jgi:hypothetical protein
MNLEEFVANVLVELDAAVDSARSRTKREIRFISNQNTRTVEFDIAVSAENTSGKSGRAGVKVLQFAEGGGQIGESNKNSTVTRIKFGLHINSKTKDENHR